jgi:hypothetical protein
LEALPIKRFRDLIMSMFAQIIGNICFRKQQNVILTLGRWTNQKLFLHKRTIAHITVVPQPEEILGLPPVITINELWAYFSMYGVLSNL